MAILRRASAALILTAVLLVMTGTAWAQAKTTVAPSVVVGARYDDNVFWSPLPLADVVWGVTPGVNATRESAHSTWLNHYSFDTEHYRDHPALTTRLARQTALSSWKFEPAASTSLTVAGGYDSTLTPSELNVTTGLGTPRLRAWRWHAGPDITQALGSTTSLRAAYLFTGDFLSTNDDILTHSVHLDLNHKMGTRDSARLGVILERFTFNGESSIRSEAIVAGMSRHLTPFTTFGLAVGPRFGAGVIRPELNASIERKAGSGELSMVYDRTQTTAIGLLTLIDVQRLVAAAAYRRPSTLEASIQGGIYVNSVAESRARVYRVAAGLTKPIGGDISIGAVYTLDYQRGLSGAALPASLVLPPASFGLAPVIFGGRLHRNVVLLQVIIAPQLKPVRQPPKEPEGTRDSGLVDRSLP